MNQGDLKDLAVLITGASRGIGRCIATRLAKEGMKLVLSATREQSLLEVAGAIQAAGGQAACVACDLSSESDLPEFVARAASCFGGLDVLINNAGWSVRKPLVDTTDEEWRMCFAVNATAPFLLARECFKHLSKSPHAAIINIGSVVGHKGYLSQGAYGASKHALMGLSKVLAAEFQPHGIRVHTINSGAVATEMIREMRPDLDPEALIDPDFIAEMVVFLLRNRGSGVVDDIHIRRASGEPWF
jgi:NAD(P)-dependent dehydrogenase (short-subunit alcohol dehydrogenase family)